MSKKTGAKLGHPGHGHIQYIKNKVKFYQDVWWKELGSLMQSGNFEEKRFAMNEFNKIQVKMIPQDITSLGEKISLVFDPAFNEAPRTTTEDSAE